MCRTNGRNKIARKMQASKEVWGKLFGTINTREKFLDHRLELAMHEWARMKANDSLECRNCHSAQSMDITRQSPRAVGFAPAVPVHRAEDLHRLPQGHRAPTARHAQRPGVAIAVGLAGGLQAGESTRRGLRHHPQVQFAEEVQTAFRRCSRGTSRSLVSEPFRTVSSCFDEAVDFGPEDKGAVPGLVLRQCNVDLANAESREVFDQFRVRYDHLRCFIKKTLK